jgi:hypothetical protein
LGGTGNIGQNPLFVRDPNDGGDGWGAGDNDNFGDLHILPDSPCMNTGDPSFVAGPDELDMDGEPRIVAGRVDMGADEFLYPGDFDLDGDVDGLDLGTFIAHWLADDCNEQNGYCDSTDLNKSGDVDSKDYGLFAGNWSSALIARVLDEDFETGDFSKYDWQHSGDASWVVVSDVKYEGSYCAKSGSISHGEQTVLEISVNTGIGSVSFYCKVSSEADEDYLRFYIDGDLQAGWSGEQDWSLQEYVITSGPHTLKWLYMKDASMSNGSDCAWIDKITLTGPMP